MYVSLENEQTPIFAIMGPTASGKTALGVELALKVGGEVINCDSVQIYKGIEIATAKGKKFHDKREAIKAKEMQAEAKAAIGRRARQ